MLDGRCDSKKMVRGTLEHEYSYLIAFSNMIDTLNVGSTYSIMVNKDSCSFMYYFLAFSACIRGFTRLRKVVIVDDTHLHDKYDNMLLGTIVQGMENHVYLVAFWVAKREQCILDIFL